VATTEQIAQLRLMINQPDNVAPYTDEELSKVIDASTSLNDAASTVWRAKAAQVAHLVDISEGGSSRKMGDVYEQFLQMSKTYGDKDATTVATTRGPRTREITRS
jgi:hypothetical protein